MPSLTTSRLPYQAIEVEAGNAFIPDDLILYFGTDGDASLRYDAAADAQLEVSGDTNWPHPKTNTAVAVLSDALVIPVTHGIVSKTVGSNAETLTLADGEDGQLLLVTVAEGKGGRGTLGPDTTTGFSTARLSDTGDTLALYFVNSTIGWTLLGAHGVLGPPVLT